MQRLHVAAFWFGLAGNIFLDLFLYVHINASDDIGAASESGWRRSSGSLAAGTGHDTRRQRAAARLFRCSVRVREEKKLAHLARRIACYGALTRPRQRLVHIGSFQYPETAHMLLSLG